MCELEIKFDNPYWSDKWRIDWLQRYIIIHSIIYYELNSSVIDDKKWDTVARQLVRLQEQNKEEAKKSMYWYAFYDFDASTGFHIYDRLNKKDKEYISKIASHVLYS